MPPRNVVVVGGGSTGLQMFNRLAATYASDPNTHVILINPNRYFAYLPASARLVISKELDPEKVLIPFPEQLGGGNKKVIQARVVSVIDDEAESTVTLDNGEKVEFTVLLLTPGCMWDGALEFADKNGEDAVKSIHSWRRRFEAAENIVLVGGGGVGVEMCGEIMDEWPTKHVTLIHGPPLLVNDTYPNRWRKRVAAGLVKRGVNIVCGDRVDDMEPKDGVITTGGGKKILADLVVPTYGPRANSKFIASSDSLGPEVLTSTGFINVTPTFQLPEHPRIFGAGDAIEWPEQKSARKSYHHSLLLMKNIPAVLEALETGEKGWKLKDVKLNRYKGARENLLLTNGRTGGTMYADLLWGIVLGDRFARKRMAAGLQLERIKVKMRLIQRD